MVARAVSFIATRSLKILEQAALDTVVHRDQRQRTEPQTELSH